MSNALAVLATIGRLALMAYAFWHMLEAADAARDGAGTWDQATFWLLVSYCLLTPPAEHFRAARSDR